jgi:uracil-DNA glycosylase
LSLRGQLAALQGSDWWPVLAAWRDSGPGEATLAAIEARERAGAVIYPAQVFRAFALTPRSRVRVVILGQDPYHGPGQAEGLAFSVPAGVKPPPSLRNIFAELGRDLGLPMPRPGSDSGSLVPWAERGLLLLNSALTVEAGAPGSHSRLGWQMLATAVLAALVADARPKVFMLWGAHAQGLAPTALATGEAGPHLALRANHPSPLAARRPPVPFIGCGHFGQASRFLAAAEGVGFDWSLKL